MGDGSDRDIPVAIDPRPDSVPWQARTVSPVAASAVRPAPHRRVRGPGVWPSERNIFIRALCVVVKGVRPTRAIRGWGEIGAV